MGNAAQAAVCQCSYCRSPQALPGREDTRFESAHHQSRREKENYVRQFHAETKSISGKTVPEKQCTGVSQ